MALSIGLVGLPNSGKSTLLNALTGLRVATASYPFTTIEPNVGVVPVEDRRLDQLSELLRPERTIGTTVEFVDVAGLVKGASRGEGLGAQFLGHLRNVDAIAMVLRAFESADVVHTLGGIDPERDAEVLWLELGLADLAVVQRRLANIRQVARSGDKAARQEIGVLERFEGNARRPKRASRPARGRFCRPSGARDAAPDGQAGDVCAEHWRGGFRASGAGQEDD